MSPPRAPAIHSAALANAASWCSTNREPTLTPRGELLDGSHAWLAQGATLHRIVYCTAFIEGSYNAQGRKNQDRYIAALRQHGSFDVLEKGKFVSHLKTAPLATKFRDLAASQS